MPAQYAHYRFGRMALVKLSGELRQSVERLRNLYDLGLQGPDPFFYHSYTTRTRIGELGSKFHNQTGREFFSCCCKRLKREPSEAGRAYLYGLLAHFCLDSHCHPFVNEQRAVSHFSLETEFDRYLLELDGYDLRRRGNPVPIVLSRRNARLVAGFYPEVEHKDLHRCVSSMAFAQKMLSTPSIPMRKLVAKTLKTSRYRDMVLTERPNRRCVHLNAQLLERFDRALECYPEALGELYDHLNHGAPLGPLFSVKFD